MARKMPLQGIVPIVAVPFSDGGEVDTESFRRLLRHLTETKVSGLGLFGIASEFYKLTDDERRELQGVFLESVKPSTKLGIVSITDHSWEVARQRALRAQDGGADMVNIFLPHFLPMSDEALLLHVQRIVEAVSIPVIIQYAPNELRRTLSPGLLNELYEQYRPRLAFKIEAQPPGRHIEQLREMSPDVPCLVGYAGVNMLDAAERGAVGVQPGCSFAEIYLKIWSCAGGAGRLYERLLPYLTLWMQTPEYIIRVEKEILYRRGLIASPYCRSSSYPLSPHDDETIKRFMAEFDEFLG